MQNSSLGDAVGRQPSAARGCGIMGLGGSVWPRVQGRGKG